MEMDTTPDPPHTLRVKRKRDEAPLSALLMEERKKKSRTTASAYVFKLAGTFEQDAAAENKGLLLEEPSTKSRKVFRLRRDGDEKDKNGGGEEPLSPGTRGDFVPKSLTDMVQSYLEQEHNQAAHFTEEASPRHHPEQQRPGAVMPDTTTSDAEIEDYVYDIYYRERADAVNTTSLDRSSVGLIMLDSDDDFMPSDSDENWNEEEEDSNAEEYYKNDYPEESGDDEDDGGAFFGSEDDAADRREGRAYMGNMVNQDDEDDYNDSEAEVSGNEHSPKNLEVDEEFAGDDEFEMEDESVDAYGERLMGELNQRIRDM